MAPAALRNVSAFVICEPMWLCIPLTSMCGSPLAQRRTSADCLAGMPNLFCFRLVET